MLCKKVYKVDAYYLHFIFIYPEIACFFVRLYGIVCMWLIYSYIWLYTLPCRGVCARVRRTTVQYEQQRTFLKC